MNAVKYIKMIYSQHRVITVVKICEMNSNNRQLYSIAVFIAPHQQYKKDQKENYEILYFQCARTLFV